MADFENSHSSKDLRKREKRMPKIENTIQIADTGESIMRIGKPSSSMEDKSIFLTSSAFKCHSHRSFNNEQSSSYTDDVLIKEEDDKEKKPNTLTGPINREMKVTSQSYGKENLEKKISSLPMSHSKVLEIITFASCYKNPSTKLQTFTNLVCFRLLL
ncbi:uncharacterized protein LOC111277281 isoform X1 [Durio zibethinus]|uniref:Uncharacterized protein LOC111277281 isoform X1 n=2 Tax=Durio zibethinus TaxID=66656 RepID=A0A6P5WU51_DURZI|nr:uncharacterized protein LOC111277281 isoform X1 [Durio zibethinus]